MATVAETTGEAEARLELLEASDAAIEAALAAADPMVLRGLLFQLTGDPELRDMKLARRKQGRFEAVAPADEGEAARVRGKAAAFLRAHRDAGAPAIGWGPRERLPESLALIVGETIMPAALDLMIEETALDPWARSLAWSSPPDPARLAAFSVIVIGTGMGGLNAALQLKRAGFRFRVIEKNDEVGGTWYENRYPGARVDTPSRSYFNLFGADFPYPYAYGPHAENFAYHAWVADRFDLRRHVTFDTEVRALAWDDAAAEWVVTVAGPGGEETLRANAVITGVGFLNRPNLAEIPGMERFRGASWHTAQWPADADLAGKRVAVIGTGCTGYQLVPVIARETAHVTVFQRRPQWLFPVPGYVAKLPEAALWLDRNLPFYVNFNRFKAFYGSGPDFVKMFDIDPDFDDPHACSAANKAARDACIAYLEATLDDPAMVAAMTPPHPPWSARPVLCDVDDNVLHALKRDDVDLVTSGIATIDETGVVDGEGRHHDVDVIVYATGFKANEFLFPMTVTGRDGVTVSELWAEDGARAYLGSMLPGFPNLFMLYGPNTNGGLPVAQFHEMTMVHALQCLEKLILEGHRAIEPSEDAYWRTNRELDALNATKIWADPRARNYWWGAQGRTASQIPYTGYEVREMLLKPDFADMIVS